jgi:hypothetical protein
MKTAHTIREVAETTLWIYYVIVVAFVVAVTFIW